ncbi:MAG: TonB family protein [Dysgonamonadaceae bacterium]|jgi:protein TonB|nr:TonB family protein [Dysgonamonadaceae bacterium]
MEAKKTPEADLENKRTIFFLMGFVVVLSAFYVLLEWKSDYTDYSGSPELLAPVFIENEFDADIPSDIENEQIIEQPVIEPEKQEQAIYEDYEIVEKVSPEEQEKQDVALNNQSSDLENLETETDQVIPTDEQKEGEADTGTDAAPQFPGGNVALIKFIYSHIQYPSAALQQRIQGRVWCSFMVNRDGTISDVALEQGVYIFLDEEAVRVLKVMPPWIPGKTQGKNEKVKVYLPVVFKI